MGEINFNAPVSVGKYIKVEAGANYIEHYHGKEMAEPKTGEASSLNIPDEVKAKLRENNILDEDGKPTGSRTEMAVLAKVLGEKMEISGWKPFERAWECKQLSSAWQRALQFKKTSELLDKYRSILK